MRDNLIREIEQFLYREAKLLDMLADDIRYWMPVRSNRCPVISKAISIRDGSKYEEDEISKEGTLAIMDEDKDSLSRRVERLGSGMAWAEDPPSRTRHFISNVQIDPGNRENELKVSSNFIMYRTRGETEENFYVGCREDVLRREGGGWKVAYRKIVLDQNVLLAKNVSNFF